jgi:NADPH-dependent curcumin reductase CurA
MLDITIPSMNQNGVIVQCGWVGGYDRSGSAGQYSEFRNLPNTIVMRLRIEG